ncbi:universal stress protein [Serinicoccus kebangsaanensis]|uniref:universal stress protein n=1 Tax=Serinicoccus kebangsaanensis TaxID=2602069 RepID=UPI00124F0769|nr:universal stress protein [Serinicoccus kebangsaanensis]
MTVVLAWTTTPEGQAAQETALAEARRRSRALVVVPLQEGEPDVRADDVEVRVHAPDARDRDVVGDFLDIAAEEDATLIVIGVKHRSAIGKLILGSTAQQILLEAAAPVLAVKTPR